MKVKDLSQLEPTRNVIYWRTTGGDIRKLLKEGYYWIDCLTGIAINSEDSALIGDFSKDIRDLIRSGDFVNEKQIRTKSETGETKIPIRIKSILTKEQYERQVLRF